MYSSLCLKGNFAKTSLTEHSTHNVVIIFSSSVPATFLETPTTPLATVRLNTAVAFALLGSLQAKFYSIYLCTDHETRTDPNGHEQSNMRGILLVAVAVCGLLQDVSGHTWIEQLRSINDQGKFVGEYGYPRGMKAKTDPGYTGDSMNWQLPQNSFGTPFINSTMPLCHPDQRQAKQSQDNYPRLKAVPGKFIAMRYMENGHVSLPNNQIGKPEKGGTIFVYGTTSPKEDEKLFDVLQWSADGQGGDKRGVLLSTSNFDDGRCYEKNDSPVSQARQKEFPNFAIGQVSDGPGNYPLFCETDTALPNNTQVGKAYTLYWVWQWNTAPGKDPQLPNGKDEYYTTCIDVDVVDTFAQGVESKFALSQQDAMSIAVSDFSARTALYTDPIKGEIGPVFGGNKTAGGPSATGSVPAQTTGGASPTGIPKLTRRPGHQKPSGNPGAGAGNGNAVTVTDTVYITVTASATGTRATPRGEYVARHRLNFKRRLAPE